MDAVYDTSVNANVLLSDTTTDWGGDMASDDTSSAVVDITSSYPWSLRYRRAIAGNELETLSIGFAGIPGCPTHMNGGSSDSILVPIEDINGTASVAHSFEGSVDVIAFMEQYDSLEDGWSGWAYDRNSNVRGYFFEPGEYRLVFKFETMNSFYGIYHGTVSYTHLTLPTILLV